MIFQKMEEPVNRMAKAAPPPSPMNPSYKSWKNKETTVDGKKIEKVVNISSADDFPDLVRDTKKKTVFEGTSLASKLKETIAAEEEAAILKRLKKGDTPEMILREGCVSLPLKNYKGPAVSAGPLEVPWWVTDTSSPIVIPPFRPKSLVEVAEERRWKRLGVNPRDTMLIDEDAFDDYEAEKVSLPPMDIDTFSDTSSLPDEIEAS
jgi:hypothetical protein